MTAETARLRFSQPSTSHKLLYCPDGTRCCREWVRERSRAASLPWNRVSATDLFWPRGEKKKQKFPHSPFSLPRQIWSPGRHRSVETESRKPLQNLFLGVGFRVCNYICLATVNQVLCNTINEEHSLSVAIWKLDMNQNQCNLLQRSAVQRILASTEELSYVGIRRI